MPSKVTDEVEADLERARGAGGGSEPRAEGVEARVFEADFSWSALY